MRFAFKWFLDVGVDSVVQGSNNSQLRMQGVVGVELLITVGMGGFVINCGPVFAINSTVYDV